MTPEGRIIAAVKRFCASRGITYIRMSFRPGVTVGWPDHLFLIPGGRPLLLEFKRPGKRPTPIQAQRLEMLRELGYTAIWCDSADAARAAILQALDAAAVSAPRG